MNWIKFGWGKNFSPIFNKKKRYHADLSKIGPERLDAVNCAVEAITRITETYPEPYNLMVSGGADSQSMLYAWLHSNKPFIANAVEYTINGQVFNDHDLVDLKIFADNNNIDIVYHKFEIDKFLENDLKDMAIRYECISPQICTHMKMSEMILDGTIIFSGNFGAASQFYDYTIFGLHRYALWSGRNIIPFFFLHDKELAGAVTSTKTFDEIDVTVPDKFNNSNFHRKRYLAHLEKIDLLTNHGFKIIPQETKMSGFEKIKDYYDSFTVPTNIKLKHGKQPSRRNFDLLYRYELIDLIKYQDRMVFIGNPNLTREV